MAPGWRDWCRVVNRIVAAFRQGACRGREIWRSRTISGPVTMTPRNAIADCRHNRRRRLSLQETRGYGPRTCGHCCAGRNSLARGPVPAPPGDAAPLTFPPLCGHVSDIFSFF